MGTYWFNIQERYFRIGQYIQPLTVLYDSAGSIRKYSMQTFNYLSEYGNIKVKVNINEYNALGNGN